MDILNSLCCTICNTQFTSHQLLVHHIIEHRVPITCSKLHFYADERDPIVLIASSIERLKNLTEQRLKPGDKFNLELYGIDNAGNNVLFETRIEQFRNMQVLNMYSTAMSLIKQPLHTITCVKHLKMNIIEPFKYRELPMEPAPISVYMPPDITITSVTAIVPLFLEEQCVPTLAAKLKKPVKLGRIYDKGEECMFVWTRKTVQIFGAKSVAHCYTLADVAKAKVKELGYTITSQRSMYIINISVKFHLHETLDLSRLATVYHCEQRKVLSFKYHGKTILVYHTGLVTASGFRSESDCATVMGTLLSRMKLGLEGVAVCQEKCNFFSNNDMVLYSPE
jgi:TATA-box binding protein (TBP) (component of TFIID and TFIIIB)